MFDYVKKQKLINNIQKYITTKIKKILYKTLLLIS